MGFVLFPIVAKHYNWRALMAIAHSCAPLKTKVATHFRWNGVVVLLTISLFPVLTRAAVSPDRAGSEFFEKHVRLWQL